MRAGAFGFRRLVGAFHAKYSLTKPNIIANKELKNQFIQAFSALFGGITWAFTLSAMES